MRPPIAPDAPQRYWRRRANRRVRKARLTRSLLRWSLVVAAQLAVLAVLGAAGWRVYQRVNETGELALERIEVVGVERASADAIRDRLFAWMGANLLQLDLQAVAAAASRDPWVIDVSAKRMLPHTLRVTVRERTPCAIAMIDGVAHGIDETGFVLGPCGPDLPDELPVLIGLEGIEGELLVAALRRAARTVERLREEAGPWVDHISEIDLSREDRITLRLSGNAPAVLLDPRYPTRNVAAWLELRRDISRRVGQVRHVDLRWRDRITVMPERQLNQG